MGEANKGRSGNDLAKVSRVPQTNRIQIMVQNFMQACQQQKKRVTAWQVLDFLVKQNYMEVSKEISLTSAEVYEKKVLKTALRSVQC